MKHVVAFNFWLHTRRKCRGGHLVKQITPWTVALWFRAFPRCTYSRALRQVPNRVYCWVPGPSALDLSHSNPPAASLCCNGPCHQSLEQMLSPSPLSRCLTSLRFHHFQHIYISNVVVESVVAFLVITELLFAISIDLYPWWVSRIESTPFSLAFGPCKLCKYTDCYMWWYSQRNKEVTHPTGPLSFPYCNH